MRHNSGYFTLSGCVWPYQKHACTQQFPTALLEYVIESAFCVQCAIEWAATVASVQKSLLSIIRQGKLNNRVNKENKHHSDLDVNGDTKSEKRFKDLGGGGLMLRKDSRLVLSVAAFLPKSEVNISINVSCTFISPQKETGERGEEKLKRKVTMKSLQL